MPDSSAPVFKAPFPVVPEFIITSDEISDLRGKIKGLNKLFQHPRRNLPELLPCLTHLLQTLSALMSCQNKPYTAKGRMMVEVNLKALSQLEDIVIRVIIRGESASDLYLAQLRRMPSDQPMATTAPATSK